jgi:hypothetical protein
MKFLTASVATFTMVGALAQAAFADTQQCADLQFSFLPVSVSCPATGKLNGIKSVSNISAAAGRTIWTYSTDMQLGPGASASPAAAAALLTSSGAFAVNKASGTLCPQAVDITVGNGPATPSKVCQTAAGGDPANATGVRIFHKDL